MVDVTRDPFICGKLQKKPKCSFCLRPEGEGHKGSCEFEQSWPILFSPSLAPLVHHGRKTETRRLLNPQPDRDIYNEVCFVLNACFFNPSKINFEVKEKIWNPRKPVFQPGRLLWVKERFSIRENGSTVWPGESYLGPLKGRSSLLMPSDRTRTLIRVDSLRYEPLEEITNYAAVNEGFRSLDEFWRTWEKLHGEDQEKVIVAVVRFHLVARRDPYTCQWFAPLELS